MNYITLCSDASAGQEVAGFAYYCRSDSGTDKYAWHENISLSSNDSEFTALTAGLQQASKYVTDDTKLVIYCDNKTVLQIVDDNFTKKTRKRFIDQIEQVKPLLTGYAEVETRHVKGHLVKGQKKYYMNRWCDINARRQMRYKGSRPIREKLYGLAGKQEAMSQRITTKELV